MPRGRVAGAVTDREVMNAHEAAHLLSDKRRRYFGASDVAVYLGVSRSYVYKLIDERRLKAHKFGRALRISRDEIERFEREASF